MRILLLLFALNAFYVSAQQASTKTSDYTQAEEEVINHRMSELARVHRIVYMLPYAEDYIRGTIMGEIKAHRKQVAPHFPERHEVPEGESIMIYMRNWAFNYPDEHAAYIAYVEKVARKFHKER